MSLLGPVRWRDIIGAPWWSWGEVTQVTPDLQVTLEPIAESDPQDVPAGNGLAGLVVGDRVWCQVTGRQLILIRKGE